jgi:hypothetical protein
MYNDFKTHLMARESWKFEYSGTDLKPYAEKTLNKQETIVADCREKIKAILNDPNGNAVGKKKQRLEERMAKAADRVEQCLVWVHECNRKPERTYNLGISDVVFFGMVNTPDPEDDSEQ